MESLANQYNIDGTVNPLVIGICILLILLGIGKLTDYLDNRKQTQCDELMSGHVVYELHPSKEQLAAIANHKRFAQTPDKFQKAVLGKLKAYDMVPSVIEATMSPEQLYEEVIRQKHALLQTNDIPSFTTEINDVSEIDNFYTMDANKYKDIKVIGDVQGCYTVLMEALSDFNQETLYIFAGDLLDRGIENDKVLQWAFDHAKEPNVIFIRGNHDVHIENWAFDALDENGEPIKLPHVFNYKTRPQLLGQKDYDQYEIGIDLKDDGLTYYTVNGQMTDIPVFWYKDEFIQKPQMTFRDGTVHLIDPYQVRHNTNYSTFTVDEFKLKKQARDLIRRFRDAVALEFQDGSISSTMPVFQRFQK